MRGIFCGTMAKNNEEYREVVRKRMYLYIGLMALGIVTIILAFTFDRMLQEIMDDHSLGFMTGVGTGLFCAGVVLSIKTRLLMNNEKKLKEDRLKYKDERIQEISGKALRATAVVLLIVFYIVLLITVVFYRELLWPVIGLIAIFFISYQVAFWIYSKKM